MIRSERVGELNFTKFINTATTDKMMKAPKMPHQIKDKEQVEQKKIGQEKVKIMSHSSKSKQIVSKG